jgi:glycosyltransferase involved in cell wall biosynthesis
LGKTILESYAQARPVVASDLGSRREFVRHGETGSLYEVGNVQALSEALRFLWERPDIAGDMGRAGLEFVRTHHSPDDHYRRMLQLYEDLLAEKKILPAKHPSLTLRTAPSTKPRLRVAFIGGRGVIGKYSGIESYYEEVGQRLAEAGHDVIIYCRSYFTPKQAEHNGMRLVRVPSIPSKHFDTFLHSLFSTLHVMWKGCDIVHYHALGPALLSGLPRLTGIKTAVTVQGLDWQRKKWGPIASAVLRAGERAAVRFPNDTIVVSQTLQSYFAKRYAARTRCIVNGAPLRERCGASQLRGWDLHPDKYVLFLGRFSPEKNCHLLVEAFERIETRAKLVLAGGSNCADAYTQKLQAHASDRIRFLDYVSGTALDALLTNAMLFVLPSDLEGLSLALLEAMGAGLCVLASDIPENREVVDGAGFTFQRGNVADLERKMRTLIAADDLRAAAGRAARQRIQEQYGWPEITRQIESAYFEVMGWQDRTPVIGAQSQAVRSADCAKHIA